MLTVVCLTPSRIYSWVYQKCMKVDSKVVLFWEMMKFHLSGTRLSKAHNHCVQLCLWLMFDFI